MGKENRKGGTLPIYPPCGTGGFICGVIPKMVKLQKVLDKVNEMRDHPRQDIGELVAEVEQLLRRKKGGAREDEEIEQNANIIARFLHRRLGLSWEAIARLNILVNHLTKVGSVITIIRTLSDFLEAEVSPTVLLSVGGVLGAVALILALLERNVRMLPRGRPAALLPDVRRSPSPGSSPIVRFSRPPSRAVSPSPESSPLPRPASPPHIIDVRPRPSRPPSPSPPDRTTRF